MIDLTDEFLRLSTGTICYWPADLDHPVAGTWDITIPLDPFTAALIAGSVALLGFGLDSVIEGLIRADRHGNGHFSLSGWL